MMVDKKVRETLVEQAQTQLKDLRQLMTKVQSSHSNIQFDTSMLSADPSKMDIASLMALLRSIDKAQSEVLAKDSGPENSGIIGLIASGLHLCAEKIGIIKSSPKSHSGPCELQGQLGQITPNAFYNNMLEKDREPPAPLS